MTKDEADPQRPLSTFGTAVRMYRTAAGMSRRQLVAPSGLTYAYLSEIESGAKVPSMQAAHKIAEALGTTFVHLAELAGRISQDPQDPDRILALTSALQPIAAVTARLRQDFEAQAPAIGRHLAHIGSAIEEAVPSQQQLVKNLVPVLKQFALALEAAKAEGAPAAGLESADEGNARAASRRASDAAASSSTRTPAESPQPPSHEVTEMASVLATAVQDLTRGHLAVWAREELPTLVQGEVAKAMQRAFAPITEVERR